MRAPDQRLSSDVSGRQGPLACGGASNAVPCPRSEGQQGSAPSPGGRKGCAVGRREEKERGTSGASVRVFGGCLAARAECAPSAARDRWVRRGARSYVIVTVTLSARQLCARSAAKEGRRTKRAGAAKHAREGKAATSRAPRRASADAGRAYGELTRACACFGAERAHGTRSSAHAARPQSPACCSIALRCVHSAARRAPRCAYQLERQGGTRCCAKKNVICRVRRSGGGAAPRVAEAAITFAASRGSAGRGPWCAARGATARGCGQQAA